MKTKSKGTPEKPGYNFPSELSKTMGQKPLDEWQIRRINQLKHDQKLAQSVIARRLNISRSAVRTNLMSLQKWNELKVKS